VSTVNAPVLVRVTSLPLEALKFNFVWEASKPRYMSDVELPEIKEKAGGAYKLSRTALTAGGKTPSTGGNYLSQLGTLVYFGFFLLMPWWSRIGTFKPVPERVNFSAH